MGRTPFYSALFFSFNGISTIGSFIFLSNHSSWIPVLTLFTAVLQSFFGTLAGFVNGRSPLLCELKFYHRGGSVCRVYNFPPWLTFLTFYGNRRLWKTSRCAFDHNLALGRSTVSVLFIPSQFSFSIDYSLRFNCRPNSSNLLCRSYAHLVSFAFLSVVWIGQFLCLGYWTIV